MKLREPHNLLTSHTVSAAYDKCITLDISFLLIKGTLIWTSTESSKLPTVHTCWRTRAEI